MLETVCATIQSDIQYGPLQPLFYLLPQQQYGKGRGELVYSQDSFLDIHVSHLCPLSSAHGTELYIQRSLVKS